MAIDIKTRASMIKPGSTIYNYYMNTPLSEFKTKEDKLLKKELEALSEGKSTFIDNDSKMPMQIIQESYTNSYALLTEAEEGETSSFLTKLGKTMSGYVSTGYEYVVDKVKELEKKVSESENGVVRAIPKIIAAAIAVLAIYYAWTKISAAHNK